MSNEPDLAAIEEWASKLPPSVVNAYFESLMANPALIPVLREEMNRDYTGAGLDAQLAEFGQHRLFDESDWSFRRRTFPAVFAHNEAEAIRLIFTCPHTLLTHRDRGLLGSLAQDTSPAAVTKWADGFNSDPFYTYHPPV